MWHYPVVCITLLLLLLVGTGCYCRCWVAMLGVDEDDNNQIEAPVDVCVYIERERVREWCVFVYCPRPRSTKRLSASRTRVSFQQGCQSAPTTKPLVALPSAAPPPRVARRPAQALVLGSRKPPNDPVGCVIDLKQEEESMAGRVFSNRRRERDQKLTLCSDSGDPKPKEATPMPPVFGAQFIPTWMWCRG